MNVEMTNIYGDCIKTSSFYIINYNSVHLYNSNYVRDANTLWLILNTVHFGYNACRYFVLRWNPRLKSYPSLNKMCAVCLN
jgi:hypothetical protein